VTFPKDFSKKTKTKMHSMRKGWVGVSCYGLSCSWTWLPPQWSRAP